MSMCSICLNSVKGIHLHILYSTKFDTEGDARCTVMQSAFIFAKLANYRVNMSKNPRSYIKE